MLKSLYNTIFMVVLLGCYQIAFAQHPNNARIHIESIAMSKVDFTPSNISVCSRYGCKNITQVSIDGQTWAKLTNRFNEIDLHPANERALLAEYIADIEKVIGRKTNTNFDVGGTFNVFLPTRQAKSDQMDCIDESTNTLTYLRLLDAEGKLRSHEIVGLVSRGGLLAGYPHTAVLILDVANNEKYVVDSWFYNNGRPAVVLPYKTWKIGWIPN